MAQGICKDHIFKEFYFKHSEYLRNFLFYKSGNLSLSEDLMQDAFLKVWENCSKVEVSKAKSYLFTVANNLFLNTVARKKVALQFQKATSNLKDKQDPHFLLEEKQFRERLETAISNLPDNQRVVFLMHRKDKKKYREIAEELEISTKAVEKRMHNALSTLRNIHKKI